MPVVFKQCSSFFIELLHEPRAVVGKNRVKRVSKNLGEDCENLAAKRSSRVAPESDSKVLIDKMMT